MGNSLAFLLFLCIFTGELTNYMKLGKLTLVAAACAVFLSSCAQKDNLSFICRCTGNALGPVETYRIDNTSEKQARKQCESYVQMPAPDSTACYLEVY